MIKPELIADYLWHPIERRIYWTDITLGRLFRYDPATGKQCIEFPARKVSSVTFGGDDLSEMYVTTALTDGSKVIEGAGAGALFKVCPGVYGVPEFFSRVGL